MTGRAGIVRRHGQVRVAIDQPGQHGRGRKINRLGTGGQLAEISDGLADGLDAVAFNPDGLIGQVGSGADIQHFSRMDYNFNRRRALRNCAAQTHDIPQPITKELLDASSLPPDINRELRRRVGLYPRRAKVFGNILFASAVQRLLSLALEIPRNNFRGTLDRRDECCMIMQCYA